jgi:2-polyprenyl-6-methoxyphenol hydroxylase-like FAD-dependent oxidoreductase
MVNTSAPDSAKECDVLVIGGGPAGSTAAALLAQKGHRVTVLEKTHHPRFHIGESLLPANLPLLETLGVADEVRAIGMMKWAAEFESPTHAHKQVFQFAEAWDPSMPYSYQVQRAEFDEILFRNAARKGATTIEGCRVNDVTFLPNEEGVIARTTSDDGAEQTWRARYLLDASGRDTFMGTRLKASLPIAAMAAWRLAGASCSAAFRPCRTPAPWPPVTPPSYARRSSPVRAGPRRPGYAA